MELDLKKSMEILTRTPYVLETLLDGISEEWIRSNEGGDTWSPFDIVGHLIHGDKTDWITRVEIILSDSQNKKFDSFNRLAQFENSKGKDLRQLLEEFKILRKENIVVLNAKNITSKHFEKKGIHPAFGEVTLRQLLATWTTHDLSHLAQISRVMARQYTQEVGPWKEYLPILSR
jgi:hypothetical protein